MGINDWSSSYSNRALYFESEEQVLKSPPTKPLVTQRLTDALATLRKEEVAASLEKPHVAKLTTAIGRYIFGGQYTIVLNAMDGSLSYKNVRVDYRVYHPLYILR